ncbi:nucleolar protein 8 isoform X2 [Hippopotamus amphibius kiboko]|uniref:nucleolar protein 8 isoform X2 n=1 Tax=Hippopotamus amphibius kiboko TaxID=575201 RepID=UPI00259A5B7E|nr:nucleolar protein 8 isoform X2 [Hippopotamus amphibius kiboko]
MKADRETKRLFVGGLSRNISEADLQNQFSRFGEVSDVEIITRKDDQGMSILNKTKWKGGTLQIQLAKESFLHRLAQEREEAKAKKGKSTTGNTNSLEKMGVVDFHVKAVPGTEVPGHKNWVVSKFGRVLPVLHLKNQYKRKIIKYDPSKYCHNLKKIGEDFTDAIPVSSLTWELEGGSDPMSKKRRGEFSDFHSPAKKIIKVQKNEGSAASLALSPKPSSIMESPHLLQRTAQKTLHEPITPKSPRVPDSDSQKLKNVFFQTFGLETTENRNSMSDDDIDSEDELRLMIAREENLEKTTWSSVNESENDPFEVVRDDFKSDFHRFHTSTGLGIKNNVSCLTSKDNIMGNDCDSDSGDTDEIIAMKKHSGKIKNSIEFSQTEKYVHKKTYLKNGEKCDLSDDCIKVQKRKNKVEIALSHAVRPLNRKSLIESSSSEDADSVSESTESEGDTEYNTMMKNCLHVSLTLADLEQLAGSNQEVPKEDTESSGQETTTKCDRASKRHRTLGGLHKVQQCIHPEEIVASLLEGEEDTHGKQRAKENTLKPKFQAFKGVGCLYGKESVKKSLKESVASNNISKDRNSLKLEDPRNTSMGKLSLNANGPSSKLSPFQHAKKANDSNQIQPQEGQSTFESQGHKVVFPSSSEKRNGNPVSSPLPLKDKKSLSLGVKTPRRGFDEDWTGKLGESSEKRCDLCSCKAPEPSPEVSGSDPQGSKTDVPLSVNSSSDKHAKDKHAEDNQKRLAAVEARQKAKEAQKKLVHSALANLDGHPEDKPTHIVFGSSSESEAEETSTREQSHPGEKLVKESSGKLFDSSDDEESGSEDDSNRFRIKPQFEGRAGQKLMGLQSHFGTDDRFRMDSRFLESDNEEEQGEINEKKTAEEEELAAEKLKALNVVHSVLHISLSNSTSKGSVAAKKFKDIIRYDPTRHDHATYERKRDDKPKESKTKRKKKREEAEKLPEVSKEMYYNIATDLKQIFQTTKDTTEKEDNTSWNEDSDGEKAKVVQDPTALTTGDEQPGGFTFSFFDSDAKNVKKDAVGEAMTSGKPVLYGRGGEKIETYRVEAVKPGKIAWQGDPRFQDSSSEEEDVTEETDDKNPSPGEVSLPEKETTRFFFFSKNDERLHGSDLFWRGVGSNISRNSWEARTNSLRMDCRKKHKDAKRRVKPK